MNTETLWVLIVSALVLLLFNAWMLIPEHPREREARHKAGSGSHDDPLK